MSEAVLIHATRALLDRKAAWLKALAHERHASDHTIAAYERDLRQFLVFLTGYHARPAELPDFRDTKTAELRAFLASRRRDGAGAKSLGRGLAGIRSFIRHLERCGLASSAGAKAMRAPRQPKSLPRPLSVVDARAVTEEAGAFSTEPWISARDVAVLTLLYGCGLRISEGLGLPGDALSDPAARSMPITGKGGKTRLVPLLPAVLDAVAEYRRLCPYALNSGEPLFPRSKRRSAETADRPAHRSTAAGRAWLAGVGDATCAAPFLRHASPVGRRRSQNDSGSSRPREPFDDATLYRGRYGKTDGDI